MLLAAAATAAVLWTADGAPDPGGGLSGGTLAVALVGGFSAIGVALVPELFKLLRLRGTAPGRAVTPEKLAALEERLTARAEARAAAIRTLAQGAHREVRALRTALEARDAQAVERELTRADRWREQLDELRDELRTELREELDRHLRREHRDPIPSPREPA